MLFEIFCFFVVYSRLPADLIGMLSKGIDPTQLFPQLLNCSHEITVTLRLNMVNVCAHVNS
jgi:hypothetical protein